MSVQLLLASSSPRRKSILNLAQIDFVTYSPQLDEATLTKKITGNLQRCLSICTRTNRDKRVSFS